MNTASHRKFLLQKIFLEAAHQVRPVLKHRWNRLFYHRSDLSLKARPDRLDAGTRPRNGNLWGLLLLLLD